MKLKLSFLFVVISVITMIPQSSSAVTFEELSEALNSCRACPVEEID